MIRFNSYAKPSFTRPSIGSEQKQDNVKFTGNWFTIEDQYPEK